MAILIYSFLFNFIVPSCELNGLVNNEVDGASDDNNFILSMITWMVIVSSLGKFHGSESFNFSLSLTLPHSMYICFVLSLLSKLPTMLVM